MSDPSAPGAAAFKMVGKLNGRFAPRWSLSRPKLDPLSNAGLEVGIAIVCVGPPLLASSLSCGLVFTWSPAAPSPHWFVLSMLKPPEANAPVTPLAAAQFWPLAAELLAMIVSWNVYGPLEPVP